MKAEDSIYFSAEEGESPTNEVRFLWNPYTIH